MLRTLKTKLIRREQLYLRKKDLLAGIQDVFRDFASAYFPQGALPGVRLSYDSKTGSLTLAADNKAVANELAAGRELFRELLRKNNIKIGDIRIF